MKTLPQTGFGLPTPFTAYHAHRHHFGVLPALCFLVVVQIVVYANYLISASYSIDTWFYSGFIASLPHHLHNFPNTYYGARLPWILPGYLLTCVFGAFRGLILLDLFFALALGLCAYLWFYYLFGFRSGLLLAVVMICIPEVAYQATNHYVSLACSTYTMASLACIEASIQSSRTRLQRSCLLCLAGAAIACAIMTNLTLVLFLPALIAYYLVRSRGTSIQEVFVDVGWTLAGFVMAILIFCLAYLKLTGTFNIFAPALGVLKTVDMSVYRPTGFEWIQHAMWLILPTSAALVAIRFLFYRSAHCIERSKYLALASASLLAIASFICINLVSTPVLYISYYTCLLLPFCLGTLIALIGKMSSLEKCSRGMALGALVAASPVGVLLMSAIFRELVIATGSVPAIICSLAAGLTLLAFWRPIRPSALVLLLLVAQSAFVRPNGDGRYYLIPPCFSTDIPKHADGLKPLFCAPAEFFSEYVRAHNYIYNTTRFRAPCFLVEGQPDDVILAALGTSVLSSYLDTYSLLDFTESHASYSKSLLDTRRYLAVLGNNAAWRDQQFQRARELVPGINFVFDCETVLRYKERVLRLALYKINPDI